MTSNRESNPTSFYASPQEARHATPEEFLYLACLHKGSGVEAPDFLAVVDAENGCILHETPMPNVGDELHHFGWNRCSHAGTLTRRGRPAGHNTIPFSGRIGRRALTPRDYRATVIATDPAGNRSAPRRATFAIARG
jgi:hypothetical protein